MTGAAHKAACPAGHESASSDFCDVCGMRMEPSPAAAGTPAATGAESCPLCGTARSGRFCETCGFDFDTRAQPPAAAGTSGWPAGSAAPLSPSAASGTATGGPAGSAAESAPGEAPGTPPQAGGDPAAAAPAAVGAQAAGAQAAGAQAPGAQAGPAAQPGSTGAAAATGWSAVIASDRDYYDEVRATGGPDAAAIQFPPYCPERRFRLTGPEMRIGRRSASRGIEPEIDLTGPPADPGISRLHAVLIAQPDGGWAVVDPGSANGLRVNGKDVPAGAQVPLADGDRLHLGAWTVITLQAG
jgi:FHA domain